MNISNIINNTFQLRHFKLKESSHFNDRVSERKINLEDVAILLTTAIKNHLCEIVFTIHVYGKCTIRNKNRLTIPLSINKNYLVFNTVFIGKTIDSHDTIINIK